MKENPLLTDEMSANRRCPQAGIKRRLPAANLGELIGCERRAGGSDLV